MSHTKESFIAKAREIHGDRYDYSKVEYKRCDEKVCIICPEHGEFWQTPSCHFNSVVGCPECGKIHAGTEWHKKCKDEFIDKANKKHEHKYDYSKLSYKTIYDKICVICPKHGEFYPTALNHVSRAQGGGCPVCAREKVSDFVKRIRKEKEDYFLSKAKELYGDKYDYSKVEYNGMNKPVTIICPIHGEFNLSPKAFLNGKGCRMCNSKKKIAKKTNKLNHEKWTYDVCKEIAKTCTFNVEFYRKCPGAYRKAKDKGWIKEFSWLSEYIPTKKTVIYVYELPGKIAYVGLTNNLENRDSQHRDENKKGVDYLTEYCVKNGIDIPTPKILEEDLTRKEGGNAEKKWIKKYKKDGWALINKNGGGATGQFPKLLMTEDEIISICKNYKNMEELANKNVEVYNLMNRLGIKKKCFPNSTFVDNMKEDYVYTDEFIRKMVDKYPLRKLLRKNETAVYMYLARHHILYDYYDKETGIKVGL